MKRGIVLVMMSQWTPGCCFAESSQPVYKEAYGQPAQAMHPSPPSQQPVVPPQFQHAYNPLAVLPEDEGIIAVVVARGGRADTLQVARSGWCFRWPDDFKVGGRGGCYQCSTKPEVGFKWLSVGKYGQTQLTDLVEGERCNLLAPSRWLRCPCPRSPYKLDMGTVCSYLMLVILPLSVIAFLTSMAPCRPKAAIARVDLFWTPVQKQINLPTIYTIFWAGPPAGSCSGLCYSPVLLYMLFIITVLQIYLPIVLNQGGGGHGTGDSNFFSNLGTGYCPNHKAEYEMGIVITYVLVCVGLMTYITRQLLEALSKGIGIWRMSRLWSAMEAEGVLLILVPDPNERGELARWQRSSLFRLVPVMGFVAHVCICLVLASCNYTLMMHAGSAIRMLRDTWVLGSVVLQYVLVGSTFR